uniref:Putative secreted protein n=1 Tax=Anopheles marajoara TaxID=58244 RepID=A0A2M4C9L7_9DIPT
MLFYILLIFSIQIKSIFVANIHGDHETSRLSMQLILTDATAKPKSSQQTDRRLLSNIPTEKKTYYRMNRSRNPTQVGNGSPAAAARRRREEL